MNGRKVHRSVEKPREPLPPDAHPGSGMGAILKMSMIHSMLTRPNAVKVCIDPKNEYRAIITNRKSRTRNTLS